MAGDTARLLAGAFFEDETFRGGALVEVDLAAARFSACQLGGARFERCDLRKASFAGAIDLAFDLQQGNKLAGARVPLDVAVRLARSFGLEMADG